MRTARYNDYFLMQIVKFVVIVCLLVALVLGGFYLYNLLFPPHEHFSSAGWITVEPTCDNDGYQYRICSDCGEEFDRETLSATGHSLEYKKENHKDHTLTMGASYELVEYCINCGAEVGRNEVVDDHTVKITEEKTEVVEPTCEEDGGYILTKTCTCGEVVETEEIVVEALGHSYEWTAAYDRETDTYSLVGVCGIDGNEISIDQDSSGIDFTVIYDETVASCCLIRYIVSCTYNGELIEVNYDHDAAPVHKHVIEYYADKDSYYNPQPEYIELPDPYEDPFYEGLYYYNIDEFPYITPYNVGNSQWNEYGFSYGAFKCHACEEHGCTACGENGHYIIVKIYSAKYDKRLNKD